MWLLVLSLSHCCALITQCYGWVCVDVNVSEWVSACLCMVFLECSHSSVIHCRVSPFCSPSSSSRFVCLCAWEIYAYTKHFSNMLPIWATHTYAICVYTYSFLSSSSSLFPDFIGIFSVSLEIYDILICKLSACIKFKCLKATFHSLFGRLYVCVCVQNAIKNSFRV